MAPTTPAPAEREITVEVRRFWDSEPCGSELSQASPESGLYFEELTRRRYELEPHIPHVARFQHWRNRDVLEVGCGPGTDAESFARAGARYTGVDLSGESIRLAQTRFQLFELPGEFQQADATNLPFEDESFDLVYSHGVIHHIPAVQRVVKEMHRVLRPGGEAIVMVYNRSSLNYRLSIAVLRRLGALILLLPGGTGVVSRLTGEAPEVIDGHLRLLRQHGLRYITDLGLFLAHNTDGPGNPYSRVYGQGEARALFEEFAGVEMEVRYLNLRSYPPPIRRLIPANLERRAGWHRYIRAVK